MVDRAQGAVAGRRADTLEALLHLLAVGLSTYRLYPGDATQPAFRTAATRVLDAAEGAVAGGAVEATVRAGQFHVDGGTLVSDRVDRLADACFSRRVEYLRIERRPTLHELAVFYDALSRDPEEVAEAGGVGHLLDAGGATAIVASTGVPSPTTGDDEDPVPDEHATPALRLLPDDTAATLYTRLRTASDALDETASGRSSFFRSAAALAADLDAHHRDAFDDLVVDRLATDTFAERYAGHLTDPQVARLIAGAARHRRVEPVELAIDVARRTGRRQALVTVVRDLIAGTRPTDTDDHDPTPAADGVRAGFPGDAEAGRRLALVAFGDYLRADVAPEQLQQVIAAVTKQLRAYVGKGETGHIQELLGVLDDARADLPGAAGRLLLEPRRQTLTPELVAGVAGKTTDPQRTVDLLRPFGPAAVDALVAALARNQRTSNGRLLEAITAVVRDRPRDLERHLDHDVWQVVRDLATVMRRVGGAAAVASLERLAGHDHAAVRREAVRGLASLPTAAAAEALERAIPRLRTTAEQKHGIEALAASTAPETPNLLRALAARQGRHRLSWRLRRTARRAARRWEAG